jgi:hypothetical protein
VETLLSDLGSTGVQQTEEPEELESTTEDPIVGVFVSDPSVHVSEEDGTALDELFDELEEEAAGRSSATETDDAGDELELVGTVGTEQRMSTEQSEVDDASETLRNARSDTPTLTEQQGSDSDKNHAAERDRQTPPVAPEEATGSQNPADGLSDRVGQLLGDAVDEDDQGEPTDTNPPIPAAPEQPSVESYADEYSEEVTEALSAAESEIDEYKSNVLYDAHPDETDFEWVSDNDVDQC